MTPAPGAGSPASEAALADAVAAAVATCPAVASLDPGGLAHRTATYLPGRRIEGVRVEVDRVTVSVVGVLGVPVTVLAGEVRGAVGPLVPGRVVDVHVADLRSRPAPPPGPTA